MAKQTFTTGQVLTAAQMTSLQQTAMGGGAATAKTASYVLVAADAGTTVAMNAAGATTITVNTGLFAAGDTVFIQNLGAGACTVTAGTATVATAGSLILPQNDAGILYFTATGASIFYDYIQAGAVSPLTTKGDVYTFSTSDARLGVGANNTVLTADSAEATGLKWAAPAASGGMTLLSTTTLSGTSTTISSIAGGYKQLLFILSNITSSSVSSLTMTVNGVTSSVYGLIALNKDGATGSTVTANSVSSWQLTTATGMKDSNTEADGYIYFTDYTDTGKRKNGYFGWYYTGNGNARQAKAGNLNVDDNNAITSVTFTAGTGSFSLGTIKTYGVN